MKTQDRFKLKYGNPQDKDFEKKNLVVWIYPEDIAKAIPVLGKSLYCNKDLVKPLERTLRELIKRGLHKEIKENDQCFCIRFIRGSKTEMSIHSWAMAIDLNPSQNPLGMSREECIKKGLTPFTKEFVQVWRDTGWRVGEDFSRPDLMHYEWTLS